MTGCRSGCALSLCSPTPSSSPPPCRTSTHRRHRRPQHHPLPVRRARRAQAPAVRPGGSHACAHGLARPFEEAEDVGSSKRVPAATCALIASWRVPFRFLGAFRSGRRGLKPPAFGMAAPEAEGACRWLRVFAATPLLRWSEDDRPCPCQFASPSPSGGLLSEEHTLPFREATALHIAVRISSHWHPAWQHQKQKG